MFVFLVPYKKKVSLEDVRPLKVYQNTKFHGLMFAVACFAFTSEFLTPKFLELLELRD
jgi:hypothetical protein